jgi:nucleoside-diphosphate-sugar epimerase
MNHPSNNLGASSTNKIGRQSAQTEVKKLRILITGASGFIGRHIAHTLHQAGHQVVACVRDPFTAKQQLHGIELIRADFTTDHTPQIWQSRVQGFDVVINSVGILREHGRQTFSSLHTKAPIALFHACHQMGVKQIIQISALGADENAFSQFHLSKKAADDYLSTLDLNWLIVMPSIVYGTGAKSMAFFKAVSCLPVVPLVDHGDQQIQPLHIDDLTYLIVKAINSRSCQQKKLPLVGSSTITIKQLFKALRTWQGFNAPRYISIPYKQALTLAEWVGRLGNAPLNAESVAMLQRGSVGDCTPFRVECGKPPSAFNSRLWESPPGEADRWHAGLYFLKPLLRWSIAFVWLLTGYLSAFVFPSESSYALLSRVGIDDHYAGLFLYGAAAIDIALGVATAITYRIQIIGYLQIALITVYTLIISIYLPEQWLHPFGPISKNLPLIIAILVMMKLEHTK